MAQFNFESQTKKKLWDKRYLKILQDKRLIKKEGLGKNSYYILLWMKRIWNEYETNKILKWCKEWGLPEPVFECTGSSIILIFRKTKLTEEFIDGLNLNERQKMRLNI